MAVLDLDKPIHEMLNLMDPRQKDLIISTDYDYDPNLYSADPANIVGFDWLGLHVS